MSLYLISNQLSLLNQFQKLFSCLYLPHLFSIERLCAQIQSCKSFRQAHHHGWLVPFVSKSPTSKQTFTVGVTRKDPKPIRHRPVDRTCCRQILPGNFRLCMRRGVKSLRSVATFTTIPYFITRTYASAVTKIPNILERIFFHWWSDFKSEPVGSVTVSYIHTVPTFVKAGNLPARVGKARIHIGKSRVLFRRLQMGRRTF